MLIGLGSSGFHSNGYSLVRKAVVEVGGLSYDDYVPELERTVSEALLEPTRLYVRCVQDLLQHYRSKTVIRGMAHITGGGLPDNLARVLPQKCSAKIDCSAWEPAPEFRWLQELGGIATDEMFHVFNMGIGFVLVVNPYFADSVCRQIEQHRIPSWVIGEVTEGDGEVELV